MDGVDEDQWVAVDTAVDDGRGRIGVGDAGDALVVPAQLGTLMLDEMLERRSGPFPDTLSDCEWEVMKMAAEEKSSKDMAKALGLSFETVESYRRQLRRRLGLRNQADLIRYVAHRNESAGH